MIRSQLGSSDAGTAALALDRLTAVALDSARPVAVRSAAIDALTAVGSPVVNSVLVAIDRPGATPASPPADPPLAAIERAAEGQIDDPESLRAALDVAGNSAPLAVLHKAGWISTARHDTGLVFWRGGVFVAGVMTWNGNGVGRSSDVLAGRVAELALARFRALARRGG